jgi:isoprenylcysteine carboxyl methyltransferase (ICMT) family protein YpbQ
MQGQNVVAYVPRKTGGVVGVTSVSTWVAVGFLALVGVQRLRETFARRQTIRGQRQMGWSFYVFFALHTLILVGALVEFLWLRKTLVIGWSALGGGLFVGSLILRNMAIHTLGRYWSLHVEIREQHQLVRAGIYNLVRHPAYAAIMVEVLSIPMVVNAWWTMLFAAITYLPLLGLRLRLEEKALLEKFGEHYRQYQSEAGALLPKPSTIRKVLASLR